MARRTTPSRRRPDRRVQRAAIVIAIAIEIEIGSERGAVS
jgi:hypothetical protein